ncbi:pentatricopeptide repeat-containing protein, mitochondrial-like [Cocos nucifera]|uniref:Pentatricopeptide repeat-containing protein, mitochondrial-like n=1 Tax=Cocos nucifera TaxID=13894 RepID=A0A8K0HSU7_COCNU|nr:pentatricopeptide repeat-containing protein, mitochondrial-like [Cocos nucifera]
MRPGTPPSSPFRRPLSSVPTNPEEGKDTGRAENGDGTGGGGPENLVKKVRALIRRGRFESALPLAKTLILSHKEVFPSPFRLFRALSPSPFAASLLVAACADLKLPDAAIDLLSALPEGRQRFPSLYYGKLLLEALVSARRYSDARHLFSLIVSCGISPDTPAYNKAIQSAVKSGNADGALELFDRIDRIDGRKPDAFTCNVLIFGLWRERRAGDAQKLFDEMVEREISPTIVTFNMMTDGYCKAGDLDSAFGMRDRIRASGLKPNLVTYNSLLSGLCRARRIDETKRLLEEMEADGLVPDGFTYNILFDGHSRCGNMEPSLALFDESMKKGVQMEAYTCSILLDGLCKDGKVSKAEEILEKLTEKGLVPTSVIYTTIVDGYCQVGDLEGAFSALRQMESLWLKSDFITYSSLINGLCKLGRMAEAEKMVKEMVEKGVFPTVGIYLSLMPMDKLADLKEALFQDLAAGDIQPNLQVYNMLIDANGRVGNFQRVSELIGDMKRKGISLIKGLCCEGFLSEAEDLALQLREEGLSPDVITYGTLISAYCKVSNMKKAIEIYEKMVKLGLKPTLATYHELISHLGNDGRMYELDSLYQKMLHNNLAPDRGSDIKRNCCVPGTLVKD